MCSMDSGRLVFSSAAPPCRAAGAGGGQMLLFGGHGGFLGGSPVVAGVEDAGRRLKRPFLTMHEKLELQMEDLVDELYGLDEQGSSSARKRRLTAEQLRALELSFEEEKRKLEPERKSELARRLGISPRQVAVWFQNRRARWKTKQLELDFDRLRAAHDELLAGRAALAADNESLRSQVILLTEKLQANGKSPSPSPAEQTAVPAAEVHATTVLAAESAKLFQREEGRRLYDAAGSTTTNGGGGVAMPAARVAAARAANDSPESYFAGARSPPSSSEDDCGASDDDPSSSVLLPDAALVGDSFEHAVVATVAADEEATLHSWEWLWN